MTYHYRLLEDVALADAAFEACGDTPTELFLGAAQAVIETMVDPTTVGETWSHTIARRAPDLPSLLFDWLGDIVYFKDAEGVVFKGVSAEVRQEPDGHWTVRGVLSGEPIDATRHELRADVKAVTKHLYDLRQGDQRWTVRVVLDI